MSEKESLDQRVHRLRAQIARQRVEFGVAYQNLAKPIQYAETGLRGFAFLRANPWVLSVVPALFTISSSVIGVVRNQPAKEDPRARRKLEREAKQEAKGFAGHAAKWGGRGWRLFKLYRGIRKFLP